MGKRVIVIGFHAGGNPACPVYSGIGDFDMPDPAAAFGQDAGCRYLKEKGCEVLPVFFARARGRMALETFQILFERLMKQVEAALPADGVYLNIGGGMLVDFVGNGDAFFVSRLRERLGPQVPIAAPMDFHGGMPYTLWKSLNILTTFRTNPHVDIADTQLRAAKLLYRSMEEGALPHNVGIRIPMVIADSLKQEEGAGSLVNHKLAELEKLEGVWSASLMTGSAWSNHPTTGSLLTASIWGGHPKEIREVMAGAAREIWKARDQYISMNRVVTPREAYLLSDSGGEGPVFIDDAGDNPTNSATGDSAYMLDLALEMKQKDILIAGIWDAGFVEKCASSGVGQPVCGNIGASVCKSGTRIFVRGIVKGLRKAPDGHVDGAKVQIDDVVVLVTSKREGVLDRSFMERFGEDCMDYKKVVVKLGYLLEDFKKIAVDCYMAASPGNVDLDFGRINPVMDHIPRPMYPFDQDFDFEPVFID